MSLERIPNPLAGRIKEDAQGKSRIENYLREIAKEMRDRGIPVGSDFRIQPQEYKGKAYPEQEVERDLADIEEKKRNFDEIERRIGEFCELYVTALLNKHFSELIIVRTSEFDDIFGHVDNLVVDRRTGEIICAVDEVSAIGGRVYKQKEERIKERNIGKEITTSSGERVITGGARIKYGLKLTRDENGQERITLGPNRYVPIFYIAIPKEALERAVSEFNPSKDSASEYERKMLQYILTSIMGQIEGLMLEEQKLNPFLKKSISRFRTIIEGKKDAT